MNYPSLRTIWKTTLRTVREQFWVFFIGVVVSATVSNIFLQSAATFLWNFFSESTLVHSLSAMNIADLSQLSANDPLAALDQLSAFGPQGIEGQIALQEFTLKLYTEALPVIIFTVLAIAVVWFLGMKYYLIATVKQHSSARAVLKSIAYYIVPELALSIWVLLRSFAWVPLLGPILALIFAPRFTLAGIYLVQDNLGIFTSAKRSFDQTRGHWWFIVRSVYITSIVSSVATTVVLQVVQFASLSGAAHLMVFSIVTQCALVFCTVSMVHIAKVLMQPTQTAV